MDRNRSFLMVTSIKFALQFLETWNSLLSALIKINTIKKKQTKMIILSLTEVSELEER